MKPTLKAWRILVGVLVGSFFLALASNPLRWPNWVLQKWLLAQVSPGSSIQHLQAAGAAKGWEVHGPQIADHITSSMLNIDSQPGEKYVIVHLGYYYSLTRTDVESIWVFDSKDCLSKLEIKRSYDAP